MGMAKGQRAVDGGRWVSICVVLFICYGAFGQTLTAVNEGSILGACWEHWQTYGDGYFVGDGDVYSTHNTFSFCGCPTIGYGSDSDHSYIVFRHAVNVLP